MCTCIQTIFVEQKNRNNTKKTQMQTTLQQSHSNWIKCTNTHCYSLQMKERQQHSCCLERALRHVKSARMRMWNCSTCTLKTVPLTQFRCRKSATWFLWNTSTVCSKIMYEKWQSVVKRAYTVVIISHKKVKKRWNYISNI